MNICFPGWISWKSSKPWTASDSKSGPRNWSPQWAGNSRKQCWIAQASRLLLIININLRNSKPFLLHVLYFAGLRRLIQIKNKELKQMKSLAATILSQRSETEQFFLESLQEVRRKIIFHLLLSRTWSKLCRCGKWLKPRDRWSSRSCRISYSWTNLKVEEARLTRPFRLSTSRVTIYTW